MAKKKELVEVAMTANIGTEEELNGLTVSQLEKAINGTAKKATTATKKKPETVGNMKCVTVSDLVKSGRLKSSRRDS